MMGHGHGGGGIVLVVVVVGLGLERGHSLFSIHLSNDAIVHHRGAFRGLGSSLSRFHILFAPRLGGRPDRLLLVMSSVLFFGSTDGTLRIRVEHLIQALPTVAVITTAGAVAVAGACAGARAGAGAGARASADARDAFNAGAGAGAGASGSASTRTGSWGAVDL